MMQPTPHNEFNKSEEQAFEPGGKYSTPKKRETEAKASDFLKPAERKYPYKVNGQVSCNLLKAAMVRAAQNKEMEVHKKAKSMYAMHCE